MSEYFISLRTIHDYLNEHRFWNRKLLVPDDFHEFYFLDDESNFVAINSNYDSISAMLEFSNKNTTITNVDLSNRKSRVKDATLILWLVSYKDKEYLNKVVQSVHNGRNFFNNLKSEVLENLKKGTPEYSHFQEIQKELLEYRKA